MNDLKTFDKILEDANAENRLMQHKYKSTISLQEICEDCNIDYIQIN